MDTSDPSRWTDCPPGALVKLPARLQRKRLVGLAMRTTATLTLLAMVSFGVWYAQLSWSQGYRINGLTCADVRELLPAYQAGKLDSRRSEFLVRHVQQCSNCAELRPQLRAALSSTKPTRLTALPLGLHAYALRHLPGESGFKGSVNEVRATD